MFDSWDFEERAICAIQEYRYDINHPSSNWPPYYFAQASYSRWAAEEIIVYILSHVNLTPLEAVEEFRNLMDDYATRDRYDKQNSYIFSVAYDIATDIYDILLAMV